MWNGWIIAILGVWSFIAPFAGLASPEYAWSHWIVGAVTLVLGFGMTRDRPAEGWITGIAGSWLFISGFIGALLTAPGIWWNNLIVGAVLVVFGIVSAVAGDRPMTGTHVPAH
jgi:hypothetical protein